MRVLRVLEVTMRDGNFPLFFFFFTLQRFNVLEVTMRDGNQNKRNILYF